MTEKEHELKMMLTKDEHHFLLRFFDKLMVESGLQTNYYYDTRDEVMRKRNVTVRVRQKNNKLIGTVKRHLDTDNCSIEECFQVDTLPRVIMWDGMPLWMQGSLMTERKTFKICDRITMMLDLNQYLDVVDYELEIEYSEPFRMQAEGMLMLIGGVVGKSIHLDTVSKSERFFQRLNSC
jgi:uncharacterized protein YjbK